MSCLLRWSVPPSPFIRQSRPGCARCGRTLRVRPPARRWLIVAALFAVTYGISTPLAAFGVFLPVIAETFGWSRGAIASALSFNLVVGGLSGYVVGTLSGRYGPRLMLLITVGLAGPGFPPV